MEQLHQLLPEAGGPRFFFHSGRRFGFLNGRGLDDELDSLHIGALWRIKRADAAEAFFQNHSEWADQDVQCQPKDVLLSFWGYLWPVEMDAGAGGRGGGPAVILSRKKETAEGSVDGWKFPLPFLQRMCYHASIKRDEKE